MIRIIEKKTVGGKKYEISLDDIKLREIYIKRIKRNRNGYEYLFLIDSKGRNLEEVFIFLNYTCGIKSINGREQAQSALKILYTFKEIIKKDFVSFNENDVKNLSDFILGVVIKGDGMEIINISSRGINTHNLYFESIRKFFLKVGIQNKYFFEKVSARNRGEYNTSTIYEKKFKYKSNYSRNKKTQNKVPKYISIVEYKAIQEFLEKESSRNYLRDKLMINLMFLFGLRIGEVLGLTIEDLYEDRILIRNRLSDQWFQKAKTCFTPKGVEDYNSKFYTLEEKGMQEVYVPEEIMNEIREYLDISRDIFEITDRKLNNILVKTKADSVEGKNENFYIFINKDGGVLGTGGWSGRLKKIYKECGIEIDYKNKRNNLSHRFRHGYAMALRKQEKDALYIMRKLRHTSLASTYKYFNPTEEDILEETKIIIGQMEKKIKGE